MLYCQCTNDFLTAPGFLVSVHIVPCPHLLSLQTIPAQCRESLSYAIFKYFFEIAIISFVDPPYDILRASVLMRYFDSPQSARIQSQDARPVQIYQAISPATFSAVRLSDICHTAIFRSKSLFSIFSRLIIYLSPLVPGGQEILFFEVFSLVFRLFFVCSPSTIRRFIISKWIYSINR